ncbi:MAG: serine/threonine protein kinase [Actinobacteria bacterium]|nr:serine/threonine protein kinase [Actinomycetota bacterium]
MRGGPAAVDPETALAVTHVTDMRSQTQLIAGRYALRSLIGRGGSAAVWHADDRELRRAVAVKHIVLGAAGSTRSRMRAMREAQAAARLHTPGVVRLYDVHEDGDDVYLIMELIRAPSLLRMVRRHGPLDVDHAAAIGRSILTTLVAVHDAGIVHRDVKPSNVLVAETGVYLTDFGIALLGDDPTLTAAGSVLGTPAYMAPEQARGARVGPSADLYGLGATLYFALEGCAPFAESGSLATAQAVRDQPHRPGRSLGRLEPIVEALLVKDPAARPDAAVAAAALDVAAGPLVIDPPPCPPQAEPEDDPSSLPPPPSHADEDRRQLRRTLLWAGALLLLLAAALALLFVAIRDHPEVPATAATLAPAWLWVVRRDGPHGLM